MKNYLFSLCLMFSVFLFSCEKQIVEPQKVIEPPAIMPINALSIAGVDTLPFICSCQEQDVQIKLLNFTYNDTTKSIRFNYLLTDGSLNRVKFVRVPIFKSRSVIFHPSDIDNTTTAIIPGDSTDAFNYAQFRTKGPRTDDMYLLQFEVGGYTAATGPGGFNNHQIKIAIWNNTHDGTKPGYPVLVFGPEGCK